MNKFLGLVAVVVLVSSQSFGFITTRTLNCGSARTPDGHMLLGVGYQLQISGGFDTHTTKPDGTIGARIPTTYQLVSTVIIAHPKPTYQELTVVRLNDDGSLMLAGQDVIVTISKDASQGVVVFGNNNATATCN